MPYSPASYEEKPYNRCIDCVFIGKKCDGPNFLAMDLPRLSEWARLRKAYLLSKDPKWTNAYIAAEADVSKTTVDRFLAGDLEDIKFSTIARIIKVLVDGTWGQYPCTMAASENVETDNAKFECERFRELYENEKQKTDYLKKQVEFKEKQLLVKDELLADRKNFLHLKDKTIQILAALLGLCVVIIIGSLIMDLANPSVGYFWLR